MMLRDEAAHRCHGLRSGQIRELVPESQAYMDLLAFERKLDQTIMRKRVDIQEALKRPMKVISKEKSLSVCLSVRLSVCCLSACCLSSRQSR